MWFSLWAVATCPCLGLGRSTPISRTFKTDMTGQLTMGHGLKGAFGQQDDSGVLGVFAFRKQGVFHPEKECPYLSSTGNTSLISRDGPEPKPSKFGGSSTLGPNSAASFYIYNELNQSSEPDISKCWSADVHPNALYSSSLCAFVAINPFLPFLHILLST